MKENKYFQLIDSMDVDSESDRKSFSSMTNS